VRSLMLAKYSIATFRLIYDISVICEAAMETKLPQVATRAAKLQHWWPPTGGPARLYGS